VASALRARWQAAASLIAGTRDVLDARGEHVAQAALAARGWDAFLLSLTGERLEAFEARGRDADWNRKLANDLWDAPPTLLAMVEEVRAVCALPSLLDGSADDGAARPARRLETPRKRAQIDAFARLVVPLAEHATRVVDVGSGHGHLTRAIAERIDAPVVGLERDVELAERARGLPTHGDADFAVTDVLRDGLGLRPGDCVLGLHACGELGDAMVEAVAAVRGPVSVALVGCCAQKRRADARAPLVWAGEMGDALALPRPLLGLSNLTPGDDGVEATRAENLAGRQRRLALHRLLSARVGVLRLGAEIDGLNRRAAHEGLEVLVARAFDHRGLPRPSRDEVDAAAAWAVGAHARARRLALPRSLLARVLELFVALDRGLYLEASGLAVRVGTVFDAAVSARNVAVVGSRSIAC